MPTISDIKRHGKRRFYLLFGSIALIFTFAGSIVAVKLMNVVPQKIGFKDLQFVNLNRPLCEDCHGDSLADAHHGTKNAISGKCNACHNISTKAGSVGVSLEKNCIQCHKKSPHHNTEAALNKECTSCHDTPGVSDYSQKVPSYKPSKITPTTDSCKNCHLEGTVDGQKVVSIKKAHHGISLKGCDICHDMKNKASKDIRICERCHDVKSLHEVLPHVEKSACIGCHGDKIVPEKPKPKS
ncbi:MAG: hypothetical protein SVZ03_13030 [Spirochaetota bacterium]|nr:hypothetical protein [Spirochaetota bacterium]